MNGKQYYLDRGHPRHSALFFASLQICDAMRHMDQLEDCRKAIGQPDEYAIERGGYQGDENTVPPLPELRGPGTRTCEASIIPPAWCDDGDVALALSRWRLAIDNELSQIVQGLDAVLA